jgi:type I restriction enzyme S subunit
VKSLPLKRLVDPVRPITYGIVQAGEHVESGIPYIRPVDMVEHAGVPDAGLLLRTTPEIARAYSRSTLKAGDIVVSIGPSFGKTMVVPDDLEGANLTQGTARVAPAGGVDARFLRWALRSKLATSYWEAAVGGATFRALNLDPLSRTPIPDLPREGQWAIADYLDAETSRIDALIAKKRRMIGLLSQRWGAFLEHRLNAEGKARVALRRLLLEPPMYGAGESGVLDPEAGPRYIRITDLNSDGTLKDEEPRFLERAAAAPFMLRDGDLLFARSGATVGKAFMYRAQMGTCCFAGYLIRFRPDPTRLLPELLYYWSRTASYWGQIRAGSIQATIENVSAERYKELLVPVPPPSRQAELTVRFQRTELTVRLFAARLERQIDLLAEHRQALITAAVTGEIDVPEAAA